MIELSDSQLQVGIVTNNPETMKEFYGETLGLPLQETIEFPDGCLYLYALGSHILKLLVPTSNVSEQGKAGLPQDVTGLRYWTITVKNIDAIVETVTNNGLPPLVGIEQFGDVRFAVLTDPDGNCFELIEKLA